MYNSYMQKNRGLRLSTVLFLYFLALIVFFIILSNSAVKIESMQTVTFFELIKYLNYSSVFVFTLTLIVSLLYGSTFIALFQSPEPNTTFLKMFLFKKHLRGKARIKGLVKIKSDRVPLSKIIIFDSAENKVGHFYADINGRFQIKIKPGEYIFQAVGFGFEGEATKPIEIRADKITFLELNCFAKEDLLDNPKSRVWMFFEKYLFLALSTASLCIGVFAFFYQMNLIAVIASLSGAFSLIIFFGIDTSSLIIRDHNGKRLRDQEIEVSDATGKKSYKIKTDMFARAYLLSTPGIYKISSSGSIPRNISVTKRSIISADLKLNRSRS